MILSQLSPQKYASYGLFPYPGTGPCATGGGVCPSTSYNNNTDRVLLGTPISSTPRRMTEAGDPLRSLAMTSGTVNGKDPRNTQR